MDEYEKVNTAKSTTNDTTKEVCASITPAPVDILTYKPTVKDRTWYVSETDLEWVSTGCYILGTGGGGSPYSHMLRMREILRAGGVVRVINPQDLKDDDAVGCGGGMGSPTVGIEKLQGDEYVPNFLNTILSSEV